MMDFKKKKVIKDFKSRRYKITSKGLQESMIWKKLFFTKDLHF